MVDKNLMDVDGNILYYNTPSLSAQVPVKRPNQLYMNWSQAYQIDNGSSSQNFQKVQWQFDRAIEGYSKIILQTLVFKQRWNSILGNFIYLRIEEIQDSIRIPHNSTTGSLSNNPTFAVPITPFGETKTAATICSYQLQAGKDAELEAYIGGLTSNSLTISLFDYLGTPLVWDGVTTGGFFDISFRLE